MARIMLMLIALVAAEIACDACKKSPVRAGALELVMEFGDTPATGVAVSASGRVFVCFPRWFKNGTAPGLVESPFSVAEIKTDTPVAYPNAAMNSWKQGDDPSVGFVNVQSVFVDHRDRLWIEVQMELIGSECIGTFNSDRQVKQFTRFNLTIWIPCHPQHGFGLIA